MTLAWGQEIPFIESSYNEKQETLSSESLKKTPTVTETQIISDEIWETLMPMPTSRSEVVAVNLEDKIYVIGGFDQNAKPSNAVEFYDPKNNSWDMVNPLPKKLHHVGAASFDQKIYVVGGYSAVGPAA